MPNVDLVFPIHRQRNGGLVASVAMRIVNKELVDIMRMMNLQTKIFIPFNLPSLTCYTGGLLPSPIDIDQCITFLIVVHLRPKHCKPMSLIPFIVKSHTFHT